MTNQITFSIDGMGGDDAPAVLVEGLSLVTKSSPNVRFLLHGDNAQLAPLVSRFGLNSKTEIIHTDLVISNEMKASQALRRGKGSSMWNAVESVKNGDASVSVSAGNTGALMAISMLLHRKMTGVHRPAMTAVWPTMTGRTVVLDVGANLDADSEQLRTFAIMGEAFARASLGIKRPKIGLLNIGSEDMKGHDEVRMAAELIRDCSIDLDYYGFVEGDDISTGVVDVVVTDGFTGNVALKSGEGVARLVSTYVKEALTSSVMSKMGAAMAMGGLRKLKQRMDPSNVNGGVLLGLNGVSVKSHGGTDARGFATACRLAINLADSDFISEISDNLARIESSELAAE